MIENRIHNAKGTRVHTTYGTPPRVGYRFVLEASGPEYVVVQTVMVSKTVCVVAVRTEA
jgi:hypothetical protein